MEQVRLSQILQCAAMMLLCACKANCVADDDIHRVLEAKLLRDLLLGYDKRVKPTYDPNTQITVEIGFALGTVESLDEKRELLTTSLWLDVFWQDEVLRWDPLEYDNLTRLVTLDRTPWLPEISLMNSVDSGKEVAFDSGSRLSIRNTGDITWVPGFRWRTSCRMDLTYFPFDVQTCYIELGNWIYTATLVNLTLFEPSVILEYYQENSAYEVEFSAYTRELDLEMDDTNTYPIVGLKVVLHRRPGYFLLNVIAPTIIITLLSLYVYLLPTESGEKVDLGITVVLAHSVMLLMVSDISPPSGDHLPLLSYYLVIVMMLSGLTLLLTIGVLCLFHQPSPSRPPNWIRRYILRIQNTSQQDEGQEEDGKDDGKQPKDSMHCKEKKTEESEENMYDKHTKTGKTTTKNVCYECAMKKCEYSEHGGTVHGDTSALEDDDVISRDVIRQEWIMLSNRVDWICFFTMALVVALISIILLSAIKWG